MVESNPTTTTKEGDIERVARAIDDALPQRVCLAPESLVFVAEAVIAALSTIESDVVRESSLDIQKLAERCAVACRSESFPSTATFETRIERVLRSALSTNTDALP